MEKIRKCVELDCGRGFVITEGEKEFFEMKQFKLPKRCPDCRERKKRESNSPREHN